MEEQGKPKTTKGNACRQPSGLPQLADGNHAQTRQVSAKQYRESREKHAGWKAGTMKNQREGNICGRKGEDKHAQTYSLK